MGVILVEDEVDLVAGGDGGSWNTGGGWNAERSNHLTIGCLQVTRYDLNLYNHYTNMD